MPKKYVKTLFCVRCNHTTTHSLLSNNKYKCNICSTVYDSKNKKHEG